MNRINQMLTSQFCITGQGEELLHYKKLHKHNLGTFPLIISNALNHRVSDVIKNCVSLLTCPIRTIEKFLQKMENH